MGWDDNGLNVERRVQLTYGVTCDPSLPYDPAFVAARDAAQAADPDLTAQLRRAVRRAHRAARAGVLRAVDRRRASRSTGARPTRRSARRLGARRSAAFLQLLRDGHAYLAEAPTLWDVDFKTAVAQAELEDRERPGAYHRIGFTRRPTASPSTSRPPVPSSLAACVALVAHPDDARYQPLFGSTVAIAACSASRSRSSPTSSPIPRRARASR